ncbi:MAG: toll/interleukin-1 receptor domain-containing protein, partial [Rhodospirillales bacterium]|nr:toll/interleukin-1 receptor domain-containing protein [Rhodospirillales bacterium]
MFGGRNREIAYSTNYFSVDDDSSMNESFSISDDGYDLFLESIGMIYWDDENKFTPEQAADHLWKNFIQGIE